MATLGEAIAIASAAHQRQVDRSGSAYILHPMRMMLRAGSDEAKMVAILHDVVEDTEWTIEALAAKGFPDTVLAAVECVTKRAGESYMDFVARAAANPIAREVKLLDLEDNMNILRLGEIGDKDLERLKKYHTAWKWLRTRVET